MTLLSIKGHDVSLQFGSQSIFKNLNFEIPCGTTRLVSTEGRGKSSLLKILAGSLTPNSGQVYYNERDVSHFSFEEWSSLRLKIGYGFDYGGLLNNRTLYDNLILPLQYHSVADFKQSSEMVHHLLNVFELGHVSQCRPSEVTGSQRKATCVARSLVLGPQVLLLDDPFAGLKPNVKKSFMRELENRIHSHELKIIVTATDESEFLKGFEHHVLDCCPSSHIKEIAA